MKKAIEVFIWVGFLLSSSLYAWHFTDLLRTPDQQATKLLKEGNAQKAATVFHNKIWQAVAYYRAKNYKEALQRFSQQKKSDGQYNAGNAAAYLGHYQDAIAFYDKSISLNSNNKDAIANREIIKKLLEDQKKQNNKTAKKNDKNNMNNKSDNNQANNQTKNQSNAKQNNSAEKNDSKEKYNKNNQHKKINPDEKQQVSNKKYQHNVNQTSSDKKLNNIESNQTKNETLASTEKTQEDKNQLLRRVSDDPGGLLRQKFLRDYIRRHQGENNMSQGDD
jgi:Ca-activated chloride channel family protein